MQCHGHHCCFPKSMPDMLIIINLTQCIHIIALEHSQSREWSYLPPLFKHLHCRSSSPESGSQLPFPLTLTFAGIAVSTFSRSPWQIMVEIHAQLTVQAFGVVSAHAVSMNLGSYNPGEAKSETHNRPHFFHSQQEIESFTHIFSSYQ